MFAAARRLTSSEAITANDRIPLPATSKDKEGPGETMTELRSIFLTSNDARGLALFYQRVAQLDLETVGEEGEYQYWRIDQFGVQLAIHDAKSYASYTFPPLASSNLTHLYFRVEDVNKFLEHLSSLGIAPQSCDPLSVAVRDPDGRTLLFGTY